jgi:hypothetical protein
MAGRHTREAKQRGGGGGGTMRTTATRRDKTDENAAAAGLTTAPKELPSTYTHADTRNDVVTLGTTMDIAGWLAAVMLRVASTASLAPDDRVALEPSCSTQPEPGGSAGSLVCGHVTAVASADRRTMPTGNDRTRKSPFCTSSGQPARAG